MGMRDGVTGGAENRGLRTKGAGTESTEASDVGIRDMGMRENITEGVENGGFRTEGVENRGFRTEGADRGGTEARTIGTRSGYSTADVVHKPPAPVISRRRHMTHVLLFIVFTLMAGAGVVLISRPTFLFHDDAGIDAAMANNDAANRRRWWGYACAMGNAFSATASYVIVDRLDHLHWAVIDFYFVPVGLLVRGKEKDLVVDF